MIEVNNIKRVLKGERKPTVVINELAANTINIKVMFWVDTFQTTRRAVHHNIRSQVMNNVVAALIAKGFSLPASVIDLKNYDPSIPLNLKVETNE